MDGTFGFHLPTRVEVGNGRLGETGKLAVALVGSTTSGGRRTSPAAGGSSPRALVVTDAGLIRAGIAPAVEDSLRQAGFVCERFDQVQPNPKDVDCNAGGEIARHFGADLIVAVGGGSVIDEAKAIAVLTTHPGRIGDYEGRGRVPGEVPPIVAVPTTAGTGSEVTRSAVITDTGRRFKMTVKDIKLAPKLAVVDPETTYALPVGLTASTGMDALVHAVEAYTCRAANPVSDAMALAAIARIYPALRRVVRDGHDKEARYDMMVGSLMAGIAFSHSDVGAVHCLAEALGGLYDVPHGVANSMFFPAVTAFNAPAAPERHARVAATCRLPLGGLTPSEAAGLLVEELARLATDIGIPKFGSLPQVRPEDFPFLAESSFRNGSTPDNCRDIAVSDYLRLLKESYQDSR